MFIRAKGKTKKIWFSMTPSQILSKGALVEASSGKLIPATNTAKAHNIIGVYAGPAITATDSDYTTDRLVPVEVPVEKWVTWTGDVTVGTLATTSVGAYFDLTTADTGDAVDQSSSTEDVVFCVKFITASKGEFVLNIGPESVGDVT